MSGAQEGSEKAAPVEGTRLTGLARNFVARFRRDEASDATPVKVEDGEDGPPVSALRNLFVRRKASDAPASPKSGAATSTPGITTATSTKAPLAATEHDDASADTASEGEPSVEAQLAALRLREHELQEEVAALLVRNSSLDAVCKQTMADLQRAQEAAEMWQHNAMDTVLEDVATGLEQATSSPEYKALEAKLEAKAAEVLQLKEQLTRVERQAEDHVTAAQAAAEQAVAKAASDHEARLAVEDKASRLSTEVKQLSSCLVAEKERCAALSAQVGDRSELNALKSEYERFQAEQSAHQMEQKRMLDELVIEKTKLAEDMLRIQEHFAATLHAKKAAEARALEAEHALEAVPRMSSSGNADIDAMRAELDDCRVEIARLKRREADLAAQVVVQTKQLEQFKHLVDSVATSEHGEVAYRDPHPDHKGKGDVVHVELKADEPKKQPPLIGDDLRQKLGVQIVPRDQRVLYTFGCFWGAVTEFFRSPAVRVIPYQSLEALDKVSYLGMQRLTLKERSGRSMSLGHFSRRKSVVQAIYWAMQRRNMRVILLRDGKHDSNSGLVDQEDFVFLPGVDD